MLIVALEQSAHCVLSDSGTVQEECAIFGVPSVTIRDVTERAETVEAGSNMLSGASPGDVLRAVRLVLDHPPRWRAPAEYLEPDVSTAVAKILLGFLQRTTLRIHARDFFDVGDVPLTSFLIDGGKLANHGA